MWGSKKRRIVELDRQLLQALGIITDKNVHINELELTVAELDERNARLHRDMAAMRKRFTGNPDAVWSEADDDASWVEFDHRANRRDDR